MPRLSRLLEKLEDRIVNKWGRWYERNKTRVPLYVVLGLLGWYFYGMLLNSLWLGKQSVFNTTGEVVESIWVFNPFKNLFVVFTPFGLGVSAFIALMVCLITNVAHRMKPGENNNILCIGAPGSYKSRGFIIPFLMGCAQRSYRGMTQNGGDSEQAHLESVIAADPKGELFEMLAPYFREKGFYVKAINFLDMAHSDGWNCLAHLDTNPDLVSTVANTIIQNTSGPNEADDFWSRADRTAL